eukprot:symbB.v1.2.038859.t1/scaffold6211.1/size20076/1
MCSDNTRMQITQGEFCCGYSSCDISCCDCGRAGCRSSTPHKDCSDNLDLLIARCSNRPVFEEEVNMSTGFRDYNCSAEVAMPWGYIDQWLGFASPVDITGISLTDDQVPDYELWCLSASSVVFWSL